MCYFNSYVLLNIKCVLLFSVKCRIAESFFCKEHVPSFSVGLKITKFGYFFDTNLSLLLISGFFQKKRHCFDSPCFHFFRIRCSRGLLLNSKIPGSGEDSVLEKSKRKERKVKKKSSKIRQDQKRLISGSAWFLPAMAKDFWGERDWALGPASTQFSEFPNIC